MPEVASSVLPNETFMRSGPVSPWLEIAANTPLMTAPDLMKHIGEVPETLGPIFMSSLPGHFVEAGDVSELVWFLVSDAGRYMTGGQYRMDLGGLISDVLSQIELGDLISDSTSSIATDARDAVRVQAMSVDGGLARVVDRVLRRTRERDVVVPGFQLRGAT